MRLSIFAVFVVLATATLFPTMAASQTVVDNSGFSSITLQVLLKAIFGKNFEDPRSIELKMNTDGTQPGILCGQLRWRGANGSMTHWHLYMADTSYSKLILINAEKSSFTDEDRAKFVQMQPLCDRRVTR